MGFHAVYCVECSQHGRDPFVGHFILTELRQYIFVNLFTGVVVDNFSYVFQTSGGAKSITREQMRSFKKVWAEFANPKTGYLERNRFAAFFSVSALSRRNDSA